MSRVVHIFSTIPGLVEELSLKCPKVTFQEITVPQDREFNEKVWKQMQDANILISEPAVGAYVDKLPNLKWLQLTWAGVDSIVPCFNDLPPPEFQITRFGGFFGQCTAEYVLGHIIANERNSKVYWKSQEQHNWFSGGVKYRNLTKLTVGILGFGDIGKCVARSCKALGMTVWGMGRQKRSELPKDLDEYRTSSGLKELLQSCDYICNNLPSTPATKNLLSGNVLSVCQDRQTFFINVGRGDVIDEKSLVHALKKGWISGAVLDVFEKEPLSQDSELWDMPGVTITPHCSSVTFPWQVAEVFIKNLQLFDEGKSMEFTVDVKRGY